jgi:Ca2+-binding EF-hand superfamily protein
MLLQQQAAPAGQDLPGAAPTPTTTPTTATPPTSSPNAAQFASATLASLLSAQEAPPSSADVAAKVIGVADTNSDGSLSPAEVQSALGADTTSGADALSKAFASIDTNGDGQISADELTTALAAQKGAQGTEGPHHGRHAHHAHRAPPSSSDLASQVLGAADTDGDGALGVTEIEKALGASTASGATDALTSAIGKLDTDGDGKLSTAELSAGIDAFRAAHHRGGAHGASRGVSEGQSAQVQSGQGLTA